METCRFIAHRIHGTGIFTYICLIFMVNVGKYTSPMDPMGRVTNDNNVATNITNSNGTTTKPGEQKQRLKHFIVVVSEI